MAVVYDDQELPEAKPADLRKVEMLEVYFQNVGAWAFEDLPVEDNGK